MARNTSILFGDYFENFINEQIASGKYNFVSEVVRPALIVFVQEENKAKSLIHTSPVNFIIMPIFAIANTNITFEQGMIHGLYSNLALGILFGLFLGKPVDIFLMSYFSVKFKLSKFPVQTNWIHLMGLDYKVLRCQFL